MFAILEDMPAFCEDYVVVDLGGDLDPNFANGLESHSLDPMEDPETTTTTGSETDHTGVWRIEGVPTAVRWVGVVE